MYFYKVKKISSKEYHVIESGYANDPEFILAKCSGPVPAGDIVNAMKFTQAIKTNNDNISNSIYSIKNALETFEQTIKEKNNKIYRNFYRCADCGRKWIEEWDSMCDDECIKCGCSMTPYKSIDLRQKNMKGKT